MKAKFLLFTLATALTTAQAQRSSRIFATADPNKGGYNWTSIRQLNKSGQDAMILNSQLASGVAIDARLQEKKANFSPTAPNFSDQPMYSGVAALAFDVQHNRLYYATMFTQQLRYIDLGDKQATRYFQAGSISDVIKTREAGYKVSPEAQGPVVTRMTIGADGYGYGLSNDGQSFFRFSLNKKTVIEELGALVDDSKNGKVSVHNQCSGWGGDMVAADNGDLYLFTMKQQVFQINPSTRVATYVGKISGLDDNFTVNGAAVDEDGSIVLSTATFAGSRARMADLFSLKATEEKQDTYFNASDLASANLIKTTAPSVSRAAINPVKEPNSAVTVYPNPVTNGFTLLQFDKVGAGRFTINLLSSSGNIVSRKPVQISSEGQQVRVNTSSLAKGLYVVRVTDASRKEVYSTKLVVQ